MEAIFDLYEKHGESDYIGELVTQVEHMDQAALIAEEMGCDKETVAAAFLHDIGHLIEIDDPNKSMGGYGVHQHEKVGADLLRGLGMSEKVCRLVELHIDAKRYLVSKDENYFNTLSEASRVTLGYQGGKMSDEELLEFEQDPLFDLALTIRHCDDLAKDPNKKTENLDKWKQLISELLGQ